MAKQARRGAGTRRGKSAAGKARKTGAGTARRSVSDRAIDAAMELAAERGWRDLSLAEIAEAAGLSIAELHAVYPSKQALLSGFVRRIDAVVLAGAEPDARAGSAKDRLFDVLMRRFDALKPYRKALGRILCDQGRDPLAALCGLCLYRRSLATMLEAADLAADGLRGRLRVKGLGLAYAGAFRTWLRDDSDDLAPTMAALDRQLGRLERAARICSRLPRRSTVFAENPI